MARPASFDGHEESQDVKTGADTAVDLSRQSHSRESLALVTHEGQLCVRKEARGDCTRFQAGVRKQHAFRGLNLAGLRILAAPILLESHSGDAVEIVMPYMHGLSGADFALHGNRSIARDLSRALAAMLMDGMSKASVADVPSSVFVGKMNQVVAASQRSPLLAQAVALQEQILQIAQEYPQLTIPLGACHGDLTLSNMIFSQQQDLVLIDFLDTYLESPLQDLAKISQELEFGWSSRHLDENLRVKGAIFAAAALPDYVRFLYGSFPTAARLFKILCIARIIPYAHDDATHQWLARVMARLLSHA